MGFGTIIVNYFFIPLRAPPRYQSHIVHHCQCISPFRLSTSVQRRQPETPLNSLSTRSPIRITNLNLPFSAPPESYYNQLKLATQTQLAFRPTPKICHPFNMALHQQHPCDITQSARLATLYGVDPFGAIRRRIFPGKSARNILKTLHWPATVRAPRRKPNSTTATPCVSKVLDLMPWHPFH